MNTNDPVLDRYQKQQRTMYAWITLALAVFSVVVFFNQETWASPIMFTIVTALLWAYHLNCGRRIKIGAFAAGRSLFSDIERADLSRWLEHTGAEKIPHMHLPG